MGMMFLAQRSRYYPEFALGRLNSRYGSRWMRLIDWIRDLSGSDPQVMAFTRTMRHAAALKPSQANRCEDPFCALCAAEAVAGYDGSEEDLLMLYHRNLRAISERIKTLRRRDVVPQRKVA